MHVLSIIAALAVALTIGFATARPAHHPGSPVVTPFDGGDGGFRRDVQRLGTAGLTNGPLTLR